MYYIVEYTGNECQTMFFICVFFCFFCLLHTVMLVISPCLSYPDFTHLCKQVFDEIKPRSDRSGQSGNWLCCTHTQDTHKQAAPHPFFYASYNFTEIVLHVSLLPWQVGISNFSQLTQWR